MSHHCEWEVKYKALCAGIEDPELIKNAEKVMELAIHIAATRAVSLEEVVDELLKVIRGLRKDPG
jgi:hypothetical protein